MIMLILFIIFYVYIKYKEEQRLNNYDFRDVSVGKMAQDAGKSKSEIRRNLVNGKYNKDENWKI